MSNDQDFNANVNRASIQCGGGRVVESTENSVEERNETINSDE